MTFDEQFPSLKNKRLKNKNMDEDYVLSEVKEADFSTNYYYNEADIQKYCLDKAKVLDALRFWFDKDRITAQTQAERLLKIKQELGL